MLFYCVERKWLIMRNLATILPLSGKCQRFNAIDGVSKRWKKIDIKWKIVKHIAMPKQRAAFRKLFLRPYHIFIEWSFVNNLFQFGPIINRWIKQALQLLLQNKYSMVAFCVFRTWWIAFYTLLTNTCSKLKVETLYWLLTQVKVNNKNIRTM